VRDVVVGRDYGAQTEIIGGMQRGSYVVVNPSDSPHGGARVQGGASRSSGGNTIDEQPRRDWWPIRATSLEHEMHRNSGRDLKTFRRVISG
jgi:hypothetical protein